MNVVKYTYFLSLMVMMIACDPDDSEGDLGNHQIEVTAYLANDFLLGDEQIRLPELEIKISENGRESFLFESITDDNGKVDLEYLRDDINYILEADTIYQSGLHNALLSVSPATETLDLVLTLDEANLTGIHLAFIDSQGNGVPMVDVHGYLSNTLAHMDSTSQFASFSLKSNANGKAYKYDLSKEIYHLRVLDTIAGLNIDTIIQADMQNGGISLLELQVID